MTRVPARLVLAFQRYGSACIVACLVLGVVVGAAGAVALANPESTTVTDHVDEQTVTVNASSTATVTEPSALFERGTVLADQAYPLAAAPNVTIVLETRTTAETRLRYEHRLALQYEITRGDDVVWTDTEPIAAANGTAENRARTTRTLSMRAVRARLGALRDAAGGSARVSVSLVVTTAYETDRYSGRVSRTAAVSAGDTWYTVESVRASRDHSTPEPRRVPVQSATRDAWALAVAGGALVVVGLLGAIARRRFDPDPEAVLRHRVHERRYDDWISNGHHPSSFDRRVVTMASLADLAELAIDRRRRIVFDESRQAYAVLDADVVYYYDEFWTDHDVLDDRNPREDAS